jgi:phage baseplate assembly protein W
MPYIIVDPGNAQTVTTTPNGLDISFGSASPFSTVYTSEQAVFNKLKNLLLTRLGERPIQPTFGTDLFRILFEVNSRELQQSVEDYISPAISYWIPEITVSNILVKTIEDDPTLNHSIIITIEYSHTGINLNTLTLTVDDNGVVQVAQGQ